MTKTKTSAGGAQEYYPLKRRDLVTFDGDATALVLEMVAAGWVGRMSANGHAIMRAPDGTATHSVSRESLRGRSGRNSRAAFERWRKKHERLAVEAVEEEGKEVDMQRYICPEPGCKREFGSSRGLAIHQAVHLRQEEVCPKCGKTVKYLDTHLRKAHAEDLHKLMTSVMDVFAEVEQLRAENEELRALLGKQE